VRKVQSTGGILSHADLEDYRVKVQPALEGSYHGRRIMTTQAPTSGPGNVASEGDFLKSGTHQELVLLHMLNVLEDFDLANHNGLNVHRMVEATKFGFAAR
jgi:gamma-glutamyltranspeptidase/glutathione hydrolase/leukotriene-C4 hydrolase